MFLSYPGISVQRRRILLGLKGKVSFTPFFSEMIQQHPKGVQARILLSSVFRPYAQDDAYGSRAINPMELYHNQVTRGQGAKTEESKNRARTPDRKNTPLN